MKRFLFGLTAQLIVAVVTSPGIAALSDGGPAARSRALWHHRRHRPCAQRDR